MIIDNNETKVKIAYSIAEASEVTSLSKAFLRNEIRAKKLNAKLVGRRVLIIDTDLRSWLEGKDNWENLEKRS